MSSFLADSQEAEARNLVALTRSKGLCLLLFPTTHVHPTGPLHSLRTLCALRHGMFHIGKDRVDLDSFAAFLTQPDTVEFAHDGITIDSRAPFTRESWLFTHQITSYGAWTFLPLALRLTMHSARFELTLALRQEVPKPSCFQVTPDLFHWQGHLLDGVRVTLSFGIGCLGLASDTFVYVRFPYPEPGHAPQLEVKGWTLTPDCGSYFFSRAASHSLGHLHPSRPGVVDPSDYARPASLLKWPDTSPATRSRYAHLPHHHTPDAPPKLLPAASIPYYHMGMDQLCQPAVLHDKDLVPSLWLAAFAALIGTSLTNEHNALLQHPLIPPQFPSRVIAPLLAGDVDTVTDYVTEILACTGPSWAVKNRRPRSSGSQSPPDDASIQELPRTTLDPLPSWVDDLFARISQLAVLIHDAQDLARSPSGWIKTSALIAYNGPSIPGNFDTHSGEIVNTSTFLLKVHGLSQPLTDEYIKGLVSKDNLRGPKRFLLGLYAPGKTTNSTQLVIRLTPIPAADPNAGAAGASSLQTSRPLTLDEAEPYGVYFFQSSMLRVLTREGIRPKKKSQPGRSSLLKVQPTDNPGPVGSSQLRGRSDACFLINMHASIKAGTEWIKYTNDGCYGTDHIPITPQFLLVAFRFTPTGSEEIWSAHSAVAPAATAHTPAAFLPHSTSIGSAQQDSRADVRLRAHLHAPPATIIPAEDDDELLDAPPDIDVPVSTAVSSALTHLEQAIDDMHSASPRPLSFDPLFYLALSSLLPMAHPHH